MVWLQPTVIPGSSPAGRGGCSSCVVGQDCVFIGGADRSPTAFDDVWVLRFEQRVPLTCRWIRKTTTVRDGRTLPARSGHSATTIGTDIYVFGGMDPQTGTCFNDVVVLCTKSWEWRRLQLTENGSPPPRNAHVACAARNDTVLIIYGGGSPEDGPMGDVHVLNVVEGREKWERPRVNGQAPDQREMHAGVCVTSATLNAHTEELVIVGGRGREGTALADVHVLDLTEMKWTRRGGFPGGGVCAHGAATWHAPNSNKNAVAVFGGFDGVGLQPEELTVLETETFRLIGTCEGELKVKDAIKPSSRFAHACVSLTLEFTEDVDGEENKKIKTKTPCFVVFGGVTPAFDLGDLYVWMEGSTTETVEAPRTVPASDLD